MVLLAGILVTVAAVAFAGVRLLGSPRKPPASRIAVAPPPLIFDETPATVPTPRPSLPARTTPSKRVERTRDRTTITDVLAALQVAPEADPRRPAAAAPEPTTRPDARRERALQRATEALQGPKAPSAVEAATPPPITAKPTPPAPTVEVHAAGPEAARFFTEGLRHQRERRYTEAIENYEKAIAADPGNLEAYNNLGVVFKEAGRLDQAAGLLQRALALDPKYEKALNNLGVVRYLKGQYEDAIGLFRRAIAINPENVESYTNLGIIYLLAERLEEARTAFERALQLDPKHAETHYNLALLYERQGIWPRALKHYQRFLELALPTHAPFVAKVRERLRLLTERQ
jgi:type IV pilus biogenesis/stability protein PilW